MKKIYIVTFFYLSFTSLMTFSAAPKLPPQKADKTPNGFDLAKSKKELVDETKKGIQLGVERILTSLSKSQAPQHEKTAQLCAFFEQVEKKFKPRFIERYKDIAKVTHPDISEAGNEYDAKHEYSDIVTNLKIKHGLIQASGGCNVQ